MISHDQITPTNSSSNMRDNGTTADSLIDQFTHMKVTPAQSPPPYEQHEPELYNTSPSNSESLSGSITPTPDIAPVAESTQLEPLYPSSNSPDQTGTAPFINGEVPAIREADGKIPSPPSAARRSRNNSDKRNNRGGENWSPSANTNPQLTIQTSFEYFQQPPVYKQHPPSAPAMLMDPSISAALSPPMGQQQLGYSAYPMAIPYTRGGSFPPASVTALPNGSPPMSMSMAGYQMLPQGYVPSGMGVGQMEQGGMYYPGVSLFTFM